MLFVRHFDIVERPAAPMQDWARLGKIFLQRRETSGLKPRLTSGFKGNISFLQFSPHPPAPLQHAQDMLPTLAEGEPDPTSLSPDLLKWL
jgi:hypothetical protein